MEIKIILNEPYPQGMAVTNRIHYYAKGLQSFGHGVELLIPKPRNKGTLNVGIAPSGQYEGVPYTYTCRRTHKPKGFLAYRYYDLRGYLGLARKLVFTRTKTDAVLLVSNDLLHILLVKCLCSLRGTRLFQEKSEFPFFNQKKTRYKQLYVNYVFQLFDGIIVISNELRNYFSSRIHPRGGLLLIPSLVDTREFNQTKTTSPETAPYVAYAGNFDDGKDGVFTLLQALALVRKKHPGLRLVMAGRPTNPRDLELVERLIRELHLEDAVTITGYIERRELVELLINASVLLLAKPASEQSSYNFPSKVAEYLATGNPVLLTSVSATSSYLSDGCEAYITPPGNVEAYAQKLDYILQNKKEASAVGERGRALAQREFDYLNQVKKIERFIAERLHHE